MNNNGETNHRKWHIFEAKPSHSTRCILRKSSNTYCQWQWGAGTDLFPYPPSISEGPRNHRPGNGGALHPPKLLPEGQADKGRVYGPRNRSGIREDSIPGNENLGNIISNKVRNHQAKGKANQSFPGNRHPHFFSLGCSATKFDMVMQPPFS